jgi:hypothetical protein
MDDKRVMINGFMRKFNLHPDPKDKRDLIRVHRTPKMALPIRSSVMDLQPSIRDQENLGACTGFGTARCVAHCMNKQGISFKGDWPSPLFNYFNSRAEMGTIHEDSGSYIRTAIKSAVKFGSCSEEVWPYVVPRFMLKPSIRAYKEAEKNQALVYERIAVNGWLTRSIDGIRQAIADGFTVVFGMILYESFMNVGADGIVPIPRLWERKLGGHCMALVEYEMESKQQFFTAANSWGKGWGKGGYCYIPASMIKKYGSDFWIIREQES